MQPPKRPGAELRAPVQYFPVALSSVITHTRLDFSLIPADSRLAHGASDHIVTHSSSRRAFRYLSGPAGAWAGGEAAK